MTDEIQEPEAPTPTVAPKPPTKPAISRAPQVSKPAAPTAPMVITCLSDDAEMRKIPAAVSSRIDRPKGDPINYKGKSYRPPSDWFPRSATVRPDTQVISYIYGPCFFADAAQALKTAYSSEHRIYIAGWLTELDLILEPSSGTKLEDLLKSTRAQIRALINAQNQGGTVRLIQGLTHGAAIADSHVPSISNHHQKILIVQGALGLVAFIGGMDFAKSRSNVIPGNGEPWSDVQVRLIGPAAQDVRRVFEDRWMDHPEARKLDEKLGLSPTSSEEDRQKFAFPQAKATDNALLETITAAPDSKRPLRRQSVAIGRTFGKAEKGHPNLYGFAPQGDYSAWELIDTGIRKAVRWIYLEDQYLVSRMARKALLAKMQDPTFEFLLMLMNNSGAAGADFPYLVTARNEFRRDLKAIDPQGKRWAMFSPKKPSETVRQQWSGSYLHSKIWIFDDGYAIVGSANCDDRGYTHDSEVVSGIASAAIDLWTGDSFAIDLRTRLWAKYLGVPHAAVNHFGKSLSLWKSLPPTAMVYENSAYENDNTYTPPSPFPSPNDQAQYERAWKLVVDPDSR